MAGLSVHNDKRSLQGTLQLYADYMHLINHSYSYTSSEQYWPVLVQYDIYQRVRNNRGHFQFTPSLLLAYHAKRVFSAQVHVSLPISLLDGHLYAPCPAWGVQISFRTIKTHRHPNAYIDAP